VPIRDVDGVDVEQGKVARNLPVKAPHDCYNARRNDHLFVTSMVDHKVNVIDLSMAVCPVRMCGSTRHRWCFGSTPVKLRFFAGLTTTEAAEALGMSVRAAHDVLAG
jgi:hypothetical protein